MSDIHPSAIIYPGAIVGAGTTIGAFSVIGQNVRLGSDNRIGSHVVIDGFTNIGNHNQIYQFASVGSAPQDLKYRGEPSTLDVGDGNIIREYVTLQPGTTAGGMRTVIGSQNLFMVSSHVGHDSHVGNNNVVANGCAIAGHVTIGNRVTIGGLSGIHQFVKIGDLAFMGGGSIVVKDVPPFCFAQGDRAGLAGINVIGMERAGYTADQIKLVRRFYRELFLKEGTWQRRLAELDNMLTQIEASPSAQYFVDFIKGSERGVCLPRGEEE